MDTKISQVEQPAEYHWRWIDNVGVWQRSMTANESAFHPIAGSSVWVSIKLGVLPNIPTNIVGAEYLVNQARSAWIQVLYEQPHLASTFDHGVHTATYAPMTEERLALWLASTFFVSEVENLYDDVKIPRERPVLCVNGKTREILLRAPHSYTDGIGAIQLLADLVSHIASPKDTRFGDEAANLAPIFDIAAGIPAPEDRDRQLGAKLTEQLFTSPPAVGLPLSAGGPDQHAFSELRLSVEESEKIVAACKRRGLTVTHAMHAALVIATAKSDPARGEKCYSSMHIYNWRPRIKAEFEGCRTALYCGTFPLTVLDPSERTFESLSQELKGLYTETNGNVDMMRAHSPWWAGLLAGISAVGKVPTGTTPVLSSLGVIEKSLPSVVGGIEVENFRLGHDLKGPFVTVYLWSWRGRMTLCADWNRGSLQEGEIDGFLKLIVQILSVSLEVDT